MNNFQTYISTIIDLSADSRKILNNCITETRFRKNELLLKEGQICNTIFFIHSGLCKSYYNQDGKEINTDFYFENDFATNIKSLTTSSKSAYEIKACEETYVTQLDKAKLLEAYRLSHQVETFGRKVLELITVKQQEHADSFKILDARQRFDNLFTKHPDFLQRVSLTQAASYLGISRETLSRFRAAR